MIKIVEELRKIFNVVKFCISSSKRFRFVGKIEFLFMQVLALALLAPIQVLSIEKIAPTSTTVTLYWTATGNDGRIGLADSYDIRYSINPITAQNWYYALKAKNPPTPKQSGSSESFLVYGLTQNTNYYFAMKVADEFPNWSRLSNVPLVRTAPPPICGDMNESGAVDITDLVHFTKFLFIDNTPLYNLQSNDLDSSGGVDISDLLYLVDYLFGDLNSIDCL